MSQASGPSREAPSGRSRELVQALYPIVVEIVTPIVSPSYQRTLLNIVKEKPTEGEEDRTLRRHLLVEIYKIAGVEREKIPTSAIDFVLDLPQNEDVNSIAWALGAVVLGIELKPLVQQLVELVRTQCRNADTHARRDGAHASDGDGLAVCPGVGKGDEAGFGGADGLAVCPGVGIGDRTGVGAGDGLEIGRGLSSLGQAIIDLKRDTDIDSLRKWFASQELPFPAHAVHRLSAFAVEASLESFTLAVDTVLQSCKSDTAEPLSPCRNRGVGSQAFSTPSRSLSFSLSTDSSEALATELDEAAEVVVEGLETGAPFADGSSPDERHENVAAEEATDDKDGALTDPEHPPAIEGGEALEGLVVPLQEVVLEQPPNIGREVLATPEQVSRLEAIVHPDPGDGRDEAPAAANE